jgi:uncharacterized protein YukE
MADEIQNIVLQVRGELELKRLNAELAKEQEFLEKLVTIQRQGVVHVNPVDIDQAAKKVRDYNKEIANVVKSMPSKSAFNSQGLQQLGYALQDFTSTSGGFAQKMNSVTNNLQMVAASLGIGGVWFIGITAAVQAVQLFANNWDSIEAWLKNLPDPEQLKKSAAFQKTQQEKLAGVLGQVTPGQTAAAGATQDAITAIGGQDLARKLEESLTASGAGMVEEEKDKLRVDLVRKGKVNSQEELDAAIGQADTALRRSQAQTRLRDLLNTATGTSPAAPGARAELEAIMRANPGRFTPGDIANFTRGNKEQSGPPAPDQDEARFADLQRQLEARGEGVKYSGTLTDRPLVDTSGDPDKDARAQMHSGRQSRAEALASGRAGPLISDEPAPRRRKGRHNYQKTGIYDPDVMQAHQQVNQMLNQATEQTNQQSAQQLRPGMMELSQKLQALQRRMSSQFSGPPTGGFTQIPEAF